LLLTGNGLAVPKPHSIVLGTSRSVEYQTDSGDKLPIKVRSLIIDARFKEYTTGPVHDVTDQVFVVRRADHFNDALPPEDTGTSRPWIWKLGGWIAVDRRTGRVTQISLPAFDSDSSAASWYRDYAAYCGTSDDGSKTYMVVSQLGKRRVVLRKEYAGTVCSAPKWERAPSRVTFVAAGEKNSFVVHSHGADPQAETPEEEGPQ
jgi:hypothetical protein